MPDYVTVLTGGSNNFQTTAEHLNYTATDFASDGVVGSVGNSLGVAPMTGGLAVNPQGTPNMTVAVTAGACYVTATPTGQASQRLRANMSSQNATIAANSTGGTRYDWIYVKIDPATANDPAVAGDDVASIYVSRSTSNTVDNGTPPSYGFNLAVVTVANGASSITNGNIADRRSQAVLSASTANNGWTSGTFTPNTITYNGNNNYSLVFNSTDLTSYISNGMRLKATRTVTAPTQCASLNGSNQYFSKTSPAGLSFTTTFTCMAWVKLSSYATGGIIARRNADTEGWSFNIGSSGSISLAGLRIASNNKTITSYQSIPLNRWVHVAATIDMAAGDTTAQKIWIDGVEVGRAYSLNGTATALVQGTSALVVGAEKSAGTNPFPGKIAQAAVFSAQLSEATIRSYISQGLSGSETNLVSAYSLSNSVNDLNANANDLSAQNSATTTNADSPFAGGANASTAYTAGTTEYAEVFDVSFSTNTTVVAQVPDGYSIPTSGGVSAVAYSTHASPLGWPLPGGIKIIGYAQRCTAFSTTSISDIPGLNITCYIPKGRQIRLAGFIGDISASVASNGGVMLLLDVTAGNVTKVAAKNVTNASADLASVNPIAILNYPNGSRTFKAQIAKGTNAATVSGTGAVTNPAWIMVELI